MKNFSKLSGNLPRACRRQAQVPLLVIAIVTIIGFSMIACDDGSDKGGNGTVITVDELPEFPSDSTPAKTNEDAEAILAELRKTKIIEPILWEMWDAIDEYGNDSGNYSFSNKTLPGGSVKVSASESINKTTTGGYKTLSDNSKAINELDDAIDELHEAYPVDYEEIERLEIEKDNLYEARYNIQFAVGNKSSGAWNHNFKGELTKAKTEGNVTVAQGSTFERKNNENWNDTVSKAGNYTTYRFNGTYSSKESTMYAFTVKTLSGSVKVILDITGEYNGTYKNFNHYEEAGTQTSTEKFSGSLKVYGSNNALLINHQIKDFVSYNLAYYMISYDPYTLKIEDAIPLTNNTKVIGTISSEDLVALYSIDVTAGTKYHVWWDDRDTSDDDYMDVMVRGYNDDGNVFFDIDANWYLDWVNYHSFTAASTGKVYIMVYTYDIEDSGSFAVAYNTTGSKPAFSVSFTSPSGANSRSLRNITDSVSIPKKFTQRFR